MYQVKSLLKMVSQGCLRGFENIKNYRINSLFASLTSKKLTVVQLVTKIDIFGQN